MFSKGPVAFLVLEVICTLTDVTSIRFIWPCNLHIKCILHYQAFCAYDFSFTDRLHDCHKETLTLCQTVLSFIDW